MASFYDARGNTYFVVTPKELRQSVDVPTTAAEAAQSYRKWAKQAVESICANPNAAPTSADRHLSNGLLVGPFPADGGPGLLIVNTDGTLAERSGNGLTIFSQFLVDHVGQDRSDEFVVHIHHDREKPLPVTIRPAEEERRLGFWVEMGVPKFGWEAVDATPAYFATSEVNGHETYRVFALEHLDAEWTRSQFVRVDNPHCVTFLNSAESLLSLDKRECALSGGLTEIAFTSEGEAALGLGEPCKRGINLQWAFVTGPGEIDARVFERAERWTKSSGSSATAIASAARHLELVTATTVRVAMLGGVAPVRFDGPRGERAWLFGEAKLAVPAITPPAACGAA